MEQEEPVPIEIVKLTRDAKDSNFYLDVVFRRIHDMAARHGSNAKAFVDDLWKLYAQASPFLGLWALVEEGHVVGHVVITVQQWDYDYVAWVNQLEHDGGMAPQGTWDAALAEFDTWARAANVALAPSGNQIKRFIMVTYHNPKFFARRAGFRVARTEMERPLR